MVRPPGGARAVVFDLRGPYAHFRKPYAAASPVTFPLPPPTAIAGLLGAIAGWGKSEYWQRLGTDGWGVAVSLRGAVRRMQAGVNLLKLKDSKDFRPDRKGTHRPTPMEFLVEPAYRLAVWHADEAVLEAVHRPLADARPVYTPCLGLAGCLASLEYRGVFPVELRTGPASLALNCVVPTAAVRDVRVLPGARQVRLLLPSRMEGDRVVTRYAEVLLDEGANPIEAVVDEYFQVDDEALLFF